MNILSIKKEIPNPWDIRIFKNSVKKMSSDKPRMWLTKIQILLPKTAFSKIIIDIQYYITFRCTTYSFDIFTQNDRHNRSSYCHLTKFLLTKFPTLYSTPAPGN